MTASADTEHYLKTELYQLLAQNPAIFDWFQAGSLDGIWYWDLENPDEEWLSPRLKEVLGFADHEVPNNASWWQEQIFAEDLESVYQTYHDHVEHGKPYDQIVRYRHKDGSTVWIRCRGMAIHDESGKPTRMLGAHTDVTALALERNANAKQAEALRQTQEQLTLAVDAAELGLWDWNMQDNSSVLSDMWLHITGLKREELNNSLADWEKRVHPEDLQATQSTLRAHANGETARFLARYRFQHGSGEWRWMESNGRVVQRAEDGSPLRMVGVMSDVTKDIELTQIIRQEKNRAEQAAQAKADFLATMSHEIRTPLNGVIGLTEVLEKTHLDDQQQRHLETIHNCGETLLALINDILDFSKIEAGKLVIEESPFSPRSMADEVVGYFAAKCTEKKLEFIASTDPRIPSHLNGDTVRVRQILLNLLSNAIKFTHRGEVSLRIDSTPNGIKIIVRDTGIGMRPETIDNIYESFTQAEQYTTREYGGTGLGLAITQRLVNLMNGNIQVESRLNEGSTFSVFLPLEEAIVTKSDANDQVDLDGLTVLSIDDNKTNLLVVEELCQSWGMSVNSCANAIEGLRALRRNGDDFDCILVDFHMPDIDGVTFCQLVREDPNINPIPIILLSSDPDSDVQKRLARLEVHHVASKPIRQQRLKELLDNAINHHADGEYQDQMSTSTARVRALPNIGRILVAEDNVINQELIRHQLSNFDAEIDLAKNGEEAVEKACSGTYDIILMDVSMPKMNGYDAARAIRQFEQQRGLRAVPILALTAHALEEDRTLAMASGMDAHITKPVRQQQLRNAMVAALTANLATLPRSLALLREHIGEERFCALLQTSHDTFKELHEQIQYATSADDAKVVYDAAHSLKGSAGGLGLTRLAEYADTTCLEYEGATTVASNSQTVERLLTKLESTIELFANVLK